MNKGIVTRKSTMKVGDALPIMDDSASIAASSRALHIATMRLGAKGVGCWNASAAQCRARLKEMGVLL